MLNMSEIDFSQQKILLALMNMDRLRFTHCKPFQPYSPHHRTSFLLLCNNLLQT